MNGKRRVVCITGCTRGLGHAMVEEFVQAGWIVAGCGRNEAMLNAIRSQFAVPHQFHSCDVSSLEAVNAFAQQVLNDLGPPDLLLNNAAIINPNNAFWDIDAKAFSDIVDINIKGTASMMRAFLPSMLKRGSGVIVNFSSGWGRSTASEVAPYCATKWAIEGLSQAVAQETRGKVAVIPLNPGIIDTEMLRRTFGEDAGHYPDPKRWAKKAVPFLAALGPKDNGRPLTAPQ